LLLSTACSDQDRRFESGPGGPLITGTLALEWTIDGAKDPAACEAIDASDFEAVLSDGFAVSELEAPCSDFAAPMALYIGDYVARTRLVDVDDLTVTRRVVLDRVRILEDQVTPLRIDFPSDYVAVPGEDDPDAGPPTGVEPDAAAPEEPPAEEPSDAGVSDAAAPDDAAAP
jgi:hypothetical protein